MRNSLSELAMACVRRQARWGRLHDRHDNAGNPYSPVMSIGLLLIVAVLALAATPA